MKEGAFTDPNTPTILLGLDTERLLRVILLINHFCIWLLTHKFSDAKVSVNKAHSD